MALEYIMRAELPDGRSVLAVRATIRPFALCAMGKGGEWAALHWGTDDEDIERNKRRLKEELARKGKEVIAWTILKATVDPCLRGGRLGIKGLRYRAGAFR